MVIREAAEDTPNRVEWEKEGGAIVGAISTPAFTDAIYENLNWKQEYSFKFRGITKERDIGKIIIFALDEPQILIPAKEKKRLQELGEWDEKQQTRYIKYRNEPDESTSDTMGAGIDYAYPEQWKKNPIGMSYAIGRSYNDYAQYRQMNLFEDFSGYQTEAQEPVEEGTGVPSEDMNAGAAPEQQISFEQEGDEWQSVNRIELREEDDL